jgi:hypothetical protein
LHQSALQRANRHVNLNPICHAFIKRWIHAFVDAHAYARRELRAFRLPRFGFHNIVMRKQRHV